MVAGSVWGWSVVLAVGIVIPWSAASKRRADCSVRPLGGGSEPKNLDIESGCEVTALDLLTSVFASILASDPVSELFSADAGDCDDAGADIGADAAARGVIPKSMMTMPGVVPLKMLSRLSARD